MVASLLQQGLLRAGPGRAGEQALVPRHGVLVAQALARPPTTCTFGYAPALHQQLLLMAQTASFPGHAEPGSLGRSVKTDRTPFCCSAGLAVPSAAPPQANLARQAAKSLPQPLSHSAMGYLASSGHVPQRGHQLPLPGLIQAAQPLPQPEPLEDYSRANPRDAA